MRFEVKASGLGKTYTVLKTNDLANASCFAESFFQKNSYPKVYVTRRGSLAVCSENGRELLWEHK